MKLYRIFNNAREISVRHTKDLTDALQKGIKTLFTKT